MEAELVALAADAETSAADLRARQQAVDVQLAQVRDFKAAKAASDAARDAAYAEAARISTEIVTLSGGSH